MSPGPAVLPVQLDKPRREELREDLGHQVVKTHLPPTYALHFVRRHVGQHEQVVQWVFNPICMPKRFVHLLGLPQAVVLDARGVGRKGSWSQSLSGRTAETIQISYRPKTYLILLFSVTVLVLLICFVYVAPILRLMLEYQSQYQVHTDAG
ncbi:hypothetical protein B0H14DRAFT_3771753 [Mycena olivaceomarginata]|nr:hypothetical protein B0H14DRAFT_3771753 [Mycena olivaceomarginata]